MTASSQSNHIARLTSCPAVEDDRKIRGKTDRPLTLVKKETIHGTQTLRAIKTIQLLTEDMKEGKRSEAFHECDFQNFSIVRLPHGEHGGNVSTVPKLKK